MYFTRSKEKNNHPNIYLHVCCLQAVLVDSLMTIDTQSTEQSAAQQLTMTTHELFTPCSRLHHEALRLPHTSRFFVVELQIFCRGQIGLKFVGTSACRTLANFLSRQTAFSLGAESIYAMFEKMLVYVTLMIILHY